MKVVIPVAGVGFKLRPHTNSQPKALIPVAGKNILSIIIDQFKERGIKEFIFVVGYLGDKIEEYVKFKHPDIISYFVHQHERNGVAHAIGLTQNIVQNDEMIIVLGDTICDFDIKKFVKSNTSCFAIKKVEDPRLFGVAVLNENDDSVIKLVEKPQIPTSNMALVGLYKIKETEILFKCIEKKISELIDETKGLSLTECLEEMIKLGIKFNTIKVESWFDCGKSENILTTNATLLKKFGSKSKISKSKNINSVIINPVSIPKNCMIENAIIGPNVTIGENTIIKNAIISNTIIGTDSKISNIILKESIIGNDTELNSIAKSFYIGDDTKIDF